MWRYTSAIALLLAPANAKNDKHSLLKAIRKLDEYYYVYYEDSAVEEDVCTCQGDTQILMNDLNSNEGLSAIFDQISDGDGVTIDSDSQTLVFHNNDGLLDNFDSICQGAGGMTLLTNVQIENCVGFPYDYKGYPNCISETCGGTFTNLDVETKTAVLKGVISDGLGLNFDGSCTTEIFFTHYRDSPSFSCGYDD